MTRDSQRVGQVAWVDLTVADADRARDFYHTVVGWQWTGLDCGGYDDYCMNLPPPPGTSRGEPAAPSETVAGICHPRGANAQLPPCWLVYFRVADLEASLARVRELGGEVVDGPRELGEGRFAVIRDPAGAYAALAE